MMAMDHDGFVPTCSFGMFSDAAMNLDDMDGVMFQEYWLQTTDESTHLEPSSFSHVLYEPHEIYQVEMENSPENPTLVYPEIIEQVVETTATRVQSERSPPENSELGIGWWIGSSCSVKDRLMLAVEYLREYVEEQEVLIQTWVPTEINGRSFLTTVDQPYSLNPNCKSLESYRNVSKTFHLAAEEDLTDSTGLPGRVFLGKFPEWTPDVRFFRRDECPRRSYAKLYNISGCLALPVFDNKGTCLAVVEIVTTTQKISYHLERESVYRALVAVDLRSSSDFFPPCIKACNELYQVAVPGILDILQSVCRTHGLPLALTWAPSTAQNKSGYPQFSEKYASCISTVDSACFVADEDLLGFLMACSEQYLFPYQGIAGKAFSMKKQCFETDITSFSKTKYPLSHHARMFALRAAVAIPLRSIHTGSVEYVLELFLPKDCQNIEEQKQLWHLLSISVQQACRSLQVITDKELEEATEWKMEVKSDGRVDGDGTETFASSHSQQTSSEDSTFIPNVIQAQEKGGNHFHVSWECPKEEPEEEFKVISHRDNDELALHPKQFLDFQQLEKTSGSKSRRDGDGHSWLDWSHSFGVRKTSKKRQTKTEKTVSLQVLQRYFAGSLKDAAKNIGVCPTTLKRICRQYGITRWPSRKIKKVSHSLRKLQLVVDSVEGAKGLIQIDSFYTIFPELSSPNVSGNGPFSPIKMSGNSEDLKSQPKRGFLNPEGIDSNFKSFSFLSPEVRISCPTGTRQLTNNHLSSRDSLEVEDPVAVLKRTCGGAELRSINQEEPKILPGLQHQTQETLPQAPIICDQNSKYGSAFRVKATFGEENIRFSLQPNWSFRELQQEIAKRFNIDDFSRIDLKYLDTECESILLTCDDDLEECKDLFRPSPNHTIKMSLCVASQPNLGSSVGSRNL